MTCLTGCGGGKKATPATAVATTTSSTPDLHELAQTYLRIAGPANAATATFAEKANRWNDQTTNAQAVKDAAPAIAAHQKADNALLHVDWPSSVAVDVKALVAADGAVVGDLNGLKNIDLTSAGDWSNQLSQDLGKFSAATKIVRADLGLPPH